MNEIFISVLGPHLATMGSPCVLFNEFCRH